MPEELKNVNTTIQLDSKTAESITGKYITYKYFEASCTTFCVICLVVLVWFVCRKMIEEL